MPPKTNMKAENVIFYCVVGVEAGEQCFIAGQGSLGILGGVEEARHRVHSFLGDAWVEVLLGTPVA